MNITEIFKANKSLVIAILVSLVVGIFVGLSFNQDGHKDRSVSKCGVNYSQSHKMPDGTMMQGETHEMSMNEMMNQMSASLKGKNGDAFDKAFLAEMIPHHEGAVVMAKQVLQTSKRPELIKLANDIISAQNKEINMMKGWMSTWFKSSEGSGFDNNVACTMDAKICPDGSAVGRQGPNCEFTPCPSN